jgi:hypothetical protein
MVMIPSVTLSTALMNGKLDTLYFITTIPFLNKRDESLKNSRNKMVFFSSRSNFSTIEAKVTFI